MLLQSRHRMLTQVKVFLPHEVASLFHEVPFCIPQACLCHWHPQQTLYQMTLKKILKDKISWLMTHYPYQHQ